MITAQKSIRIVFQTLSVLGIIATIAFFIYGFQIGMFQSPEIMSKYLSRAGYLGVLLFILIQIVQVVVPIIPGGMTTVAGVIIFGAVNGFIYNYVGIVIGSVINFLLARRYGKTLVRSVVSQKTYDKYIGWLDKGKRFDRLFALAILLPLAPDDFLCLLAGLTKMNLKKFTVIILLCKPAGILGFSLGLSRIVELIMIATH